MSDTSEATLRIIIDADSSKAAASLKQTSTKTKNFSDTLKGTFGGTFLSNVLSKSIGWVTKFGKESIGVYTKSEQALTIYKDSMAKIPGASDAMTASLMDQASGLSKTTAASAGAIRQAQAMFATVGLNADQIKKLTPLLVDYATKTGKDIPKAASDLVRALMGQGRALKAIGINFKNTGTLEGNFAQLTTELEGKVGGLGEKMGKTAKGEMAIMEHQVMALKKAFGEFLLPIVEKVINVLFTLVKWLKENSDWLTIVGGAILGLAAAIKVASIAMKLWGAARAFAKAVGGGNVVAIIKLVVVGIAALVAGIKWLYENVSWFHDFVDATWQATQKIWDVFVGVIKAGVDAIVAAVQWIWDKFDWVFKGIWEIVKKYMNLITLPIRIAMDLIKAIFAGDWDKVLDIFLGIPRRIIDALGGVFGAVTDIFKKAFQQIIDWLWPGIWEWFKKVPGWIGDALSGVFDAILAPFKKAWEWIQSGFDKVWGWIKDKWNKFARTWNKFEVDIKIPENKVTKLLHVANKGFTFGLPDLPILQKGGYVDRPTLALIHGGEYVLPTARLARLIRDNSGGRSGPALNIEHATFSQEVDVDLLLRRAEWAVKTRAI